MISIKKISIFALVLLLVGAIGSILTYGTLPKPSSVSEEKVINEQNITSIQVDTDNVGVEIIPTKDQVTKIELSGMGSTGTRQSFSANVNGTTLSIKVTEENINFFSFNLGPLKLKVYLPEKQYSSLQINSQNGSIQAQQMNILDVRAKTNNGRIELKNMISTTVNVESENGKISLDYVEGKIKGKTTNGQIAVQTKDLDRMMELNTENGAISIRTGKEPTNVKFDARVQNGHINILDQYNSNAVIGKGENIITLTTKNGAITVSK